MFVCLCNNVKESDVAAAIAQGANSFDDVQTITGAATGCGECHCHTKQLVNDLLTADNFYCAA